MAITHEPRDFFAVINSHEFQDTVQRNPFNGELKAFDYKASATVLKVAKRWTFEVQLLCAELAIYSPY